MSGPDIVDSAKPKIGILVVEEERQIPPLLQMGLEPHGFEVKSANNVRDGLQLLQSGKDDTAIILLGGSILISDPQGTLASFRSLAPTVPLLVMTGDLGVHDVALFSQCGVLHVVEKPFRLGELIPLLKQVASMGGTAHQDDSAPES